ncbi:hypothetical protein [Nonomuraea zeae]|uniref:Uncharacterized protein n=1 Tax=Nonomuraea zeae TaxID=1642303 RepID=A0A5S4FFE7_9ACTN|nr:hypothetical protein [Nonomuraea zeae]TMR17954.1 hypothetical protein ETD85_54040 [Nonomuraea zeae]
MTFSTVVAGGFVIAIVCIIVWMVVSLTARRPSMRRGSGNPSIPFISGTSWPDGSGGSGGGDCNSGYSGGDSGGGGN